MHVIALSTKGFIMVLFKTLHQLVYTSTPSALTTGFLAEAASVGEPRALWLFVFIGIALTISAIITVIFWARTSVVAALSAGGGAFIALILVSIAAYGFLNP